MPGEPWTAAHVEILAREYFAVLDAELSGIALVKNEALRRAQAAMPVDRTIHTLKDRCYRISEELWKKDLPWVKGWPPSTLAGQDPNTANMGSIIWEAIEPMTERYAKAAETTSPPATSETSQGYVSDAELRKAIEDVAQNRLMEHFQKRGWTVEDMHLNSPYDARATKGVDVQYLEAKGTTSDAKSVFVTSGEVEWARAHPGQCVMGIVSNIQFDSLGQIDLSSGTLALVDWAPDDGTLKPIQFTWSPLKDE